MALAIPNFHQAKTYTARSTRQALQEMTGRVEGVDLESDLKVVQRGAGANMSVDIGIGDCFVQGDTVARQGLYHGYSDAVENRAIGAAHATLPRIDRVVARIYDTVDIASATDELKLEVVAGTATSGATQDNLSGAAAVPANALSLATVLVPAAASSITQIRDKRAWSRGFMIYDLNAVSSLSIHSNLAGATDMGYELSFKGTVLATDPRLIVRLNNDNVAANYMATIHRAYQSEGVTSGQDFFSDSTYGGMVLGVNYAGGGVGTCTIVAEGSLLAHPATSGRTLRASSASTLITGGTIKHSENMMVSTWDDVTNAVTRIDLLPTAGTMTGYLRVEKDRW